MRAAARRVNAVSSKVAVWCNHQATARLMAFRSSSCRSLAPATPVLSARIGWPPLL